MTQTFDTLPQTTTSEDSDLFVVRQGISDKKVSQQTLFTDLTSYTGLVFQTVQNAIDGVVGSGDISAGLKAKLSSLGNIYGSTAEYNAGTGIGGAQQRFTLRSTIRTELSDAGWVPDTYGSNYVWGTSGDANPIVMVVQSVDGWVTVEQFGAQDYDATLGFDSQGALDAVFASGHKVTIANPENRYAHSDILDITADKIRFFANGGTLLATDTTPTTPQQAVKFSGLRPLVKDLNLETLWTGASTANSNAAAAYFELCDGFKAYNVNVRGTLANPFPNVGILTSNSSNGKLQKCFVENTRKDGIHHDWATNIKTVDCEVVNTGDDGFACVAYNNASGYPQCTKVKFTNCISRNSAANGLRFSGCKDGQARGIEVYDPAKSAINIQADAAFDTMGNERITVDGVHAVGGGDATGRIGAVAVLGRADVGTSSCKEIRIKNAECYDSAGVILKVGEVEDVQVDVNGNGGGSCTFGAELQDEVVGLKVKGRLSTCTEHGVSAAASTVLTDVEFRNLELHNINTSADGTKDGFNIPTSCTLTNVKFIECSLSSTTTLNNFIEAEFYEVYVKDCFAPNHNVRVGVGGNGICLWLEQPSKTEIWTSAAPASGTFFQGSRAWNLSPTPGGVMGWVCTTGGTPGTWKAFGSVSA